MSLPLEKDVVFASVSKPSTPDPQVLHQPQVLHLMSHQHVVKAPWRGHQRSCREFRVKTAWSNLHSWLQAEHTVKSISLGRALRLRSGVSGHKASPGCLASLGLMQRTYQGSLDIKISVKPTRLLLNWVTTWGENVGYEWWCFVNHENSDWMSIIVSYSFRSPLGVWFRRRKTVFDNGVLGLSHDLKDNRETIWAPNIP